MATVPIPRAVLAALAGGTLLGAFLLGRQCSRAEAPAPVAQAPTSAPSPPAVVAEVAAEPVIASPPPGTAPAALPVATLLAVATPAASVPVSTDVTRYFAETAAIQARAKYWSDPQALAKTILDEASGGNPGAIDELIRAQAEARRELERLTVPAECAEHHRRSLAVMSEGLALLDRVRNVITTGDLGGLDGLQQGARALEQEARAIDELGRAIRGR